MRRRVEEPLSIDADVVVETLERHGYEGMAEFVRHLAQRLQTANQREMQVLARNDELTKRLRKHEPQPEVRSPVWTGD